MCLVCGGQEINTGEAGIEEWLSALANFFPHFSVHISPQLNASNIANIPRSSLTPELHLSTSIRSFRAGKLSDFVGALIDGTSAAAKVILPNLDNYPLVVTRDLERARQ